MNKVKLIVDVAQQVLKVVEDFVLYLTVSKWYAIPYWKVCQKNQRQKPFRKRKQSQLFPLKVRGVLAGKVRQGIQQKSEQSYPSMVQAVLVISIQKTMLQY